MKGWFGERQERDTSMQELEQQVKANYWTTLEDKPPDVTNKTSQKQTTKQTLINWNRKTYVYR